MGTQDPLTPSSQDLDAFSDVRLPRDVDVIPESAPSGEVERLQKEVARLTAESHSSAQFAREKTRLALVLQYQLTEQSEKQAELEEQLRRSKEKVAQLEERLDRLDPEQGHISSLEKSLAKALEERIRSGQHSMEMDSVVRKQAEEIRMLRAMLEQKSEASSPKRCTSPKRTMSAKRSMSVGEMNTTASTIDGDRTDRRDSKDEVTEKKSKEHGKERRQNEERRKLMARSGEGVGLDKKRSERSSSDLRSRQRLLQKELVAIKSRQFGLAGERAEASARGLSSDPREVQARLEALVQSRPVALPTLPDLDRPVTGPRSRPTSGLEQARALKTSGTAPVGSAPMGAVGWSGVYLADV